MRFSEYRVIAWIVLAVCVIGSVFGLGGAGMARERSAIMEVFNEGADDRDSAHCMRAYIGRAFENAEIMALEVQLRLDKGHETATELLELVRDYDPAADDGFDSGLRIKIASQLADDLYNDMYAAGLDDAQRRDFKAAYDDYQGAMKFIQKDPYLEMAKDFNDARNANFVSELACLIGGADRLCESF